MSERTDGWDDIEVIPGAKVFKRTIEFVGNSLGRLSMLPAQTDQAVARREPRGPEFNTSER